MSFKSMRDASARKSALAGLQKDLEKVSQKGGGGGNSDDRFWQPTVDKEGNGSAIIRFLPAVDGETVPFVRVWDHGFQGPGGWYIEKSRTTIGEADPVAEYNSELWNSGNDEDKEIARAQKRRLGFISNIYVVKDSGNPENEGKTFLYKYGKKIFDKVNDMMNPSFEDEEAVNPFDLWEGANFRLRIRKVDGYRNYDKSEFDKPAPLADDDTMEAIWKSEYPLQPFVDPKEFKSYEELKARMQKVLGLSSDSAATKARREDIEEEYTPAPRQKARDADPIRQAASAAADDDDDDLAFFRKLREDD